MSNLSSKFVPRFSRFYRGFAFVVFLLSLTNLAYAQRQDRIKKSRELRTLLADVDDLRLPGFASLSVDKQKKRLQDLRAAYQGFIPLGLEKDLWAGFHQRLDLQVKLLETTNKDRSVDSKAWQLLAVDLWQLAAQIVNLDFVPSGTPSFAKGENIFQQHCAECHGPKGNGQGQLKARLPVPATRFDSTRQLPEDTVIRFFTHISIGRKERGMPGFEEVLSQEEIWHVAFYAQALNADCAAKQDASQDFFTKHEKKYLDVLSLRQLVFETDDWLLAKTRRLGFADDQQNRYILRCILPFFEKIKRY